MNRATCGVLLLLGFVMMLGGVVLALREFAGLYLGVLDDPLAQPEGAEQGVSRRMLIGAAIGAVGVPLAIVGSIALKRRRRTEREGGLRPSCAGERRRSGASSTRP